MTALPDRGIIIRGLAFLGFTGVYRELDGCSSPRLGTIKLQGHINLDSMRFLVGHL